MAMIVSLASERPCAFAILVSPCLILVALASAVAEEAALSTRSAEELVEAALRSELAGPSALRAQLLEEAIRKDPDYAPARWQSGYVKYDGEWLKVDEVPRRARANESLAQYRKLRDGLIETADNHRALARWCHKNRLVDEARIHWAKVLEFERDDAEAIAALGLQLYNGRLLTKSQIDQEKKQAADAVRALHEWQPKLMKWRTAIEHGGAIASQVAIDELRKVDDPEVIPALQLVFATNATGRVGDALNRHFVETVGRIDGPTATQAILREAIQSNSPDVRAVAIFELKKRPPHAYLPQLIALWPESLAVQFSYQISIMPTGQVLSYLDTVRQGESYEHSNSLSIVDDVLSLRFQGAHRTDRSLNDAQLRIARTQARLAASTVANQQRIQLVRQRVSDVLRQTMRADIDSREGLDKLWQDYSDTYAPVSLSQPYRSTSSVGTFLFIRTSASCFPVGTPVETLWGPQPIESLKAGDRVLAQNVESGEIGYKSVERTTLRPPIRLVDLHLGTRSIQVTPGHPFWVVGQGWRMAKTLKPGDCLHALDGAISIDRAEELPPVEAYNLVVSEAHTYFVGEQKMLVHDNMPMEETLARVPGLRPDRLAEGSEGAVAR
jgi:hypothetical protein